MESAQSKALLGLTMDTKVMLEHFLNKGAINLKKKKM